MHRAPSSGIHVPMVQCRGRQRLALKARPRLRFFRRLLQGGYFSATKRCSRASSALYSTAGQPLPSFSTMRWCKVWWIIVEIPPTLSVAQCLRLKHKLEPECGLRAGLPGLLFLSSSLALKSHRVPIRHQISTPKKLTRTRGWKPALLPECRLFCRNVGSSAGMSALLPECRLFCRNCSISEDGLALN
jgi:hypothetical protein